MTEDQKSILLEIDKLVKTIKSIDEKYKKEEKGIANKNVSFRPELIANRKVYVIKLNEYLKKYKNLKQFDHFKKSMNTDRKSDLNDDFDETINRDFYIKFEDHDLSIRSLNALAKLNVKYVGDLIQYTEGELLASRNLGRKSVEELKNFLQQFDLSLTSTNHQNPKFNSNNNFENQNKNLFITKIIVTNKTKFEEIEEQIINDIESWFLSLNKNQLDTIKQRLGYQTDILTLEQIGKKYKVTRERIRQIEAKATAKISKFVSFDLDSLNSYLKKHEYKGFNNMFPKLSSFFFSGRIMQKKRDIGDTNFNYFLEKYCKVKPDFFTTPEKVALNIFNNINQVKNLFKNMVLPFSKEEFSYQISTELGIPKDLILGTFEYLIKQKILIKLNEDKFYPLKITKKDEILAILNSYPKGIHTRDLFQKINSSPSTVKVSKYHSFSIQGALEKDSSAMFCGKGSVKLLKFSNIELIDKKTIFPLISDYLKKNSMVTSLDSLFENLRKFLPEEVDIFDLRYVIKNSGKEYGVFFSGKSQARTVSLDKPVRLNRSQEIYNYIKKLDTFVTVEMISKKLKISEGVINGQIGDLVKSGKFCRYSVNNYTSNQYAFRNFNDDEVSADILKILQSNKFVTNDFIAEKLNDKYYESKSNYFYSSYLFYLNIKNKMNMNYHQDIFSFDVIPTKSFIYIVRGYINENDDMEENYRSLSNSMSISYARFKRFFYHHYIYGAI